MNKSPESTLMKRLTLLSLIFLMALTIKAQDEKAPIQTVFGNKSGFGGYLGVNTKFTEINGQEALFTGGEVAFVVNRSFNIGVEGYGMVNHVRSNNLSVGGDRLYVQMGYGGLHLEPVIYSESVIHLTVPVLLGAGGVGETTRPYWIEDNGNFDIETDLRYGESDYFFVAEPGLRLEVNLFKFLRVAGGASYRFMTDVEMGGLETQDLKGFNADLSLRFGWF
jgi:hypothetical protein